MELLADIQVKDIPPPSRKADQWFAFQVDDARCRDGIVAFPIDRQPDD
jgi:hypothetical protein